MTKYDFAKEMKSYYNAKKKPETVNFDERKYLTILGVGEPAGAEFTAATEALYPLAYGVKKICKGNEQDFGVAKLEGLWWVNGDKHALEVDRSEWHWKLMIQMPSFVTQEIYEAALDATIAKKKLDKLGDIVFENYKEGKSVQMTHIGPYATEPETINMIFDYIRENALQVAGLHHEIYISDPRKTDPEKLKTIIRYPVKE